jgi:serine/threonine-protein kinase
MTMTPASVRTPWLFSLSAEGTLGYAPGSEDPGGVSMVRTLVWVDREGNEEPVEAPSRPYRCVELSPDGTHVAVDAQAPKGLGDIWILDLTRDPVTQQRLTFDPQLFYQPLWTPDGQRVVFNSARDGKWNLSSKAANGTGSVESLHTSKHPIIASAWSTDSRSLIFWEFMEESNSDILALSLDGESTTRPLIAESYSEGYPAISPDGRWIAYFSDESGQYNVYVRPFPNVDDEKWLISTRGGVYPRWAPDGRELYYLGAPRSGDPWGVMVVAIETKPAFAAGNPEVLFRGEYVMAGSILRPYDISPDGRRFLMIKEDSQAREAAEAAKAPPTTELIVVENWDEVLKDIAPPSK